MTHTDPIKALVEHMERHIEQYYGTEHTPQFNWAEWKDILVALNAAEKMASKGRDDLIATSPAPVVPDLGATMSKETEAALKGIDDNIRNARANGNILVGAPAPVDGERVRAAKIEAFDEALSIAEGSYSYGEQQNEIIAGIRAALAAINGEK